MQQYGEMFIPQNNYYLFPYAENLLPLTMTLSKQSTCLQVFANVLPVSTAG